MGFRFTQTTALSLAACLLLASPVYAQYQPMQPIDTMIPVNQLQPSAGTPVVPTSADPVMQQQTIPETLDQPAQPLAPQTAQPAAEPEIYVAPDEPVPSDENYKHFEAWLDEFKAEARSKGISQAVLDDAFNDLDEPSEDVIAKDKTQPEVKQTWPEYLRKVLTQRKIDAARQALQDNRQLLTRIENTYNVQPEFVVALWGMESNFGKNQGSTSIIQSLTTLAYDGRRAAFFRKELLNALKIMQQENIQSADLLGSWAGAMGQTQFMPSSFLSFAQDFNGDGKKDIWGTDADALASIANYLHQKGWDDNAPWGVPVALPENTQMDWATMKENFPLSDWKKFGVRNRNGSMLKGVTESARLVMLDGNPDQAYLVFSNYDVLMDWNRSVYFATTVSKLADAIGDDQ